jgi:diguanylate cyclase (GGDEF)-like protein
MSSVLHQNNEDERLAALREYERLDTADIREYDDISLLASQVCGTRFASISLVDETKQRFKSPVGFQVIETPRDTAFCSYTILDSQQVLVVKDATKDDRFAENPLVIGPTKFCFYAGAAILTHDDLAIGTLCVFDDVPRELTDQQVEGLQALARQLSVRIELRRTTELLRQANDELRDLSLTDELTGIYNRRGFYLHAEQQIKLFRSRQSERSLWLMLGDMDGLKEVNDQHGHVEGSEAIKETAEILVHTFRDADILARPGGDEFTVLILNTLDEVAEKVPKRLQINFEKHNAESGKPYKLAMSIGLVKVPFDEETSISEMVRLADAAMYAEKRQRKADRSSQSE